MEQLEELRQKILGSVVPLIIDNADTGSDKFSLILRLIQSGNADEAMFAKAYESAAAIEDTSERLDAMMELLEEVEFGLDRYADDGEDAVTDEAVPLVEPQTEDHDPLPEQHDEQYQDPQYEEHHDQQQG